MHFYNDSDPYVAQWLGNLVEAGCLPQGTVDARSIAELSACDVAGYRQAHFFAGIGGWPYALELAGWPSDRPVWTGSCPCQPFSTAGQAKAGADKRHLWPQWFRLILVEPDGEYAGEAFLGASAMPPEEHGDVGETDLHR